MISVKKIPIDSTWAEFWNVVFIPDPEPRCCGGRLFITAARFGEPKAAIISPVANSSTANSGYGKFDREHLEQREADRRADHAAGRERPRAVSVRRACRTPDPR